MLRDVSLAHDLRYVALHYFNVAGADPRGRSSQSTLHAMHLIKVAVQAALGQRPYLEVFWTDYPTPHGTCLRDYIHVTDLTNTHLAALAYLRQGGKSEVLNCGYGRGFSVLDVIASVKSAANKDFAVHIGPRRPGDPAALVARVDRIGEVLGWSPRRDDLDTIVGHALSWERRLIENPLACKKRSNRAHMIGREDFSATNLRARRGTAVKEPSMRNGSELVYASLPVHSLDPEWGVDGLLRMTASITSIARSAFMAPD